LFSLSLFRSSFQVVFEEFFVVALYVPNSGMKLERLSFRLKKWNPCLEAFVARLETQELMRPAVNKKNKGGWGGREKCGCDGVITCSKEGVFMIRVLFPQLTFHLHAHSLHTFPVTTLPPFSPICPFRIVLHYQVVCGDLNVAHCDVDVWNYFATHLKKQPGCTLEERQAFTQWLGCCEEEEEEGEKEAAATAAAAAAAAATSSSSSSSFSSTAQSVVSGSQYVDAFRHVHGNEAKGAYSYWSTRSNGRPENKGLRLDYFVCSSALATSTSTITSTKGRGVAGSGGGGEKQLLETSSSSLRIADSYILPHTTATSDHCPVALVLSKQNNNSRDLA
jgi:exonuclease III